MFEDPDGEAYRALVRWRKAQDDPRASFEIYDARGLPYNILVMLVPGQTRTDRQVMVFRGTGANLSLAVDDALSAYRRNEQTHFGCEA